VKKEETAPRNRTLSLTIHEKNGFRAQLKEITGSVSKKDVENSVIHGDIFEIMDFMPSSFVDLLFVDPPYNMTKKFNLTSFKKLKLKEYMDWMDAWLGKIIRLLKPTASIYICGIWESSSVIHLLCDKYFIVRNRITFEREKGRGSRRNWKNNSEDIWFCTVSNRYTFNSGSVKLKKHVRAPYRVAGKPKGWFDSEFGKFRLTFPSNIWVDITIPFWSMRENTPHPTQKPEKLLAKIVLASSNKGDVVFDPFAGTGVTGVVARKLGRKFTLVEIDEEYCLYALKRLEKAGHNRVIQGYGNGFFWERNVPLHDRKK
jgi:site-specific DNA-methyltransferase (adenine-specific)